MELFSINPHEMTGMDPNVACHRLNVDTKARYVSQRWKRQSKEKAEATASTVKGLLDAKFISEEKYTEWLFYVVLAKKASENWRMCVNYTDLNKACLNYSYPLPNIDKLVDNLTDY